MPKKRVVDKQTESTITKSDELASTHKSDAVVATDIQPSVNNRPSIKQSFVSSLFNSVLKILVIFWIVQFVKSMNI